MITFGLFHESDVVFGLGGELVTPPSEMASSFVSILLTEVSKCGFESRLFHDSTVQQTSDLIKRWSLSDIDI